MRIDLVYHFMAGQLLNKGCQLMGLSQIDNALVSGAVMVGKELTDASIDLLDIGFGILGWISLI